MCLSLRNWRMYSICLLTFFSFGSLGSINAQQTCPDPDNPANTLTLKQSKIVLPLTTQSAGFFKGLLEYLPEDFDPSGATRYPVIIYFHGVNGGTRTSSNPQRNQPTNETLLCNIITDGGRSITQAYSLPMFIEKGTFNPGSNPDLFFPETVTNDDGENFQYIVISPQSSYYGFPDNYPGANYADSVIQYVKANYPVDTTRIYLTGLSVGANIVMEYVGSSVKRAESVAAVAIASLCAPINATQNQNAGLNIGTAKLPVYIVHCQTDGNCNISIPRKWRDDINAVPNGVDAILYEIGGTNTAYSCAGGDGHNAWFRLYDPYFTEVGGKNVYEWFVDFQTLAVLPVSLSDYSVRLNNGKVQVRWTTTSETNNKSFTIERAGADQRFTAIGTVNGAGNSSTPTNYEFVDNMPLSNISYYRLTQTDIDGKREVFEIKQVVNNAGNKSKAIISPNPFGSTLSVFVSVQRSQKVSVYLTDMSGRRVATQSGVYSEGSPINLNTSALRPGVYFVKVESEGIAETHRVIKQ